MTNDEQQLQLLSVFHYVAGGLTALAALIPSVHLAVGVFLLRLGSKASAGADVPPAFLGWFFIVLASMLIITGLALAVCMVITGRSLARRIRYSFCVVIAGIECIFMPIGTVLGVFSLIVLMRPSVKALFGAGEGAEPSS